MQRRPMKLTLAWLNELGVFGRLVLVLAGFWMVGGTLYNAKEVSMSATEAAGFVFEDCMRLNAEIDTSVDCFSVRKQTYEGESASDVGGPLVVGVIISSFWLALALIVIIPAYHSIRWIIAGRRRQGRN